MQRCLPLILKVDVSGSPVEWMTYQDGAYYLAKDRVAWTLGSEGFRIFGGTSRLSGTQSYLDMDTIMAIKPKDGKYHFSHRVPTLTNRILFRRDLHLCAYCGHEYTDAKLTRDHVTPVSQKGANKWTNVVTACKPCNTYKGSKTPEQANMKLLYVPYTPDRAEHLILQNRNILADQMEFLIKQVANKEQSRLF